MRIKRVWAMPNKWTFEIKPIGELLKRHGVGPGWIDPFAGISTLCEYRNDLNPRNEQPSRLYADEYLSKFTSVEGCVFDPPYTLRQVKECYDGFGKGMTKDDTQNAIRWTRERDLVRDIIRPGGFVISFGYSTTCMGMKRGFKIVEILIVSHGSAHYDTLVTVEKKI